MKKIILFVLCIFSLNGQAEVFNKKCTSQSGKSLFNINIDTVSLRGVIDYEFMGQRINYEILKGKYVNSIFTGIATFLSSETGETHGKSFVITYEVKNNILKETNTKYLCNWFYYS